jgi:hypothetical protein
MKLTVDPLVDPELHDPFEVTGPRAEGQPVQRMGGALALIHSSAGRREFLGAEGDLGGKGNCENRNQDGGCVFSRS